MNPLTILMAEDDPDDRFLMGQAFKDLGIGAELRFVEDGDELMRYLCHSGKYTDAGQAPRPALILLDLNMPRKDGRQALVEIKADDDLKSIPVIIWTTSSEVEDKIQCRNAGAEAYITKPSDYDELLSSIRELVVRFTSREATA